MIRPQARPSTGPHSEPSPEPAWEVATLFPPQGDWNESDYLTLATNRLVELSDGRLEVLPMPTEWHQWIVAFLFRRLSEFVALHDSGVCLFAPVRVRVASGRFREPDIVFMRKSHSARRSNRFWDGADLVMEVVSDDDPDRDWVIKRREYEEAAIPEYWIVDPRDRSITVLCLDASSGRYRPADAGQPDRESPLTPVAESSARSRLLPGFSVPIRETFEWDGSSAC